MYSHAHIRLMEWIWGCWWWGCGWNWQNFKNETEQGTCIFPFSPISNFPNPRGYVQYMGCQGVDDVDVGGKWCPTKITNGENGNGNEIGLCEPDCPTHQKVLSNLWKQDETFKMTLQYENSVLMKGIQLHVKLLFGILIVGLILTTLLPAIRKMMVRS